MSTILNQLYLKYVTFITHTQQVAPLPIIQGLVTPQDLIIATVIFASLISKILLSTRKPPLIHRPVPCGLTATNGKERSPSVSIWNVPVAAWGWIMELLRNPFKSYKSRENQPARHLPEQPRKNRTPGERQFDELYVWFEAEQQRQWEMGFLQEQGRLMEERRRAQVECLLEEQRQREVLLLEQQRQAEAQRRRQREARLRKEQRRQYYEARRRQLERYCQRSAKLLTDVVTWLPKLLSSLIGRIALALWTFSPRKFWVATVHRPIMCKITALQSLLPRWTFKSQEPKALPPKHIGLRDLATGTRTLLELLSETLTDNDGAKKVLVDAALANNLAMVMQLNSYSKTQLPEEEDTFLLDAACVVCYAEVSDTVVMPCNHLAMCTSCCDKMGMIGSDWGILRRMKCPICRTDVTDRMKIYRS